MIRPNQIRAARSLLDWSQRDLADASGVGFSTIQRLERAESGSGLVSTAEKLKEAFEQAGIVFIDAGPDGGPGVRLAK